MGGGVGVGGGAGVYGGFASFARVDTLGIYQQANRYNFLTLLSGVTTFGSL